MIVSSKHSLVSISTLSMNTNNNCKLSNNNLPALTLLDSITQLQEDEYVEIIGEALETKVF